MSIFIDPQTRQRVVYDKHGGDITYDANLSVTSLAVGQETVPVIGPWQDWTGSANPNSANQQQRAGQTNVLQGTTAQIEGGAKLPVLGIVGQRVETTRRRTRKIYREEIEGKLK